MIQHGLLDQGLHLLAMGQRFRQFSFDRECRRNNLNINLQRQNLFIAGMARAGSTALLNTIFTSGRFAATTYSLMPFVLAPSMAGRMSSLARKNGAMVERAHGDGIQVGVESPEALDGVFWSTYFPSQSIGYAPRSVPEPVLQKYAIFIENLLVEHAADRYLCKMNQGIDKLESLAEYFPQSTFLIPFRDPLQQVTSLRRQHRRFSNLSWYEKRYLDWQQHYEFGDLHRGFVLDEARAEPDRLNYWLQQWHRIYDYLFDLARRHDNLILLCYESLAGSKQPWRQLERRLELKLDGESFINRNRESTNPGPTLDSDLHKACTLLYDGLSEYSEARLC